MREYEAMIISKVDVSETDWAKMVARWESIIQTDGGEIVKKDPWGARRLAYTIEKQNRGNIVVYDVATSPDNIHELERILKLDENVLRSLVIKLADDVNVEERRLELQKMAEEAQRREAEANRERAEGEVINARRGQRDEEL